MIQRRDRIMSLAEGKNVDNYAFSKELEVKAKDLEGKYPQTFKITRGYHVLLGSSESNATIDDFKGEDSVESYLEKLEAKYRSNE